MRSINKCKFISTIWPNLIEKELILRSLLPMTFQYRFSTQMEHCFFVLRSPFNEDRSYKKKRNNDCHDLMGSTNLQYRQQIIHFICARSHRNTDTSVIGRKEKKNQNVSYNSLAIRI